MKFSVLYQNRIVYSNSIQGTLLSMSSNGLGNKTVFFMSVCSIVKQLPLGTIDDLMHYCTWPSALCNSASGHPRHPRVIVLTILQTGMK